MLLAVLLAGPVQPSPVIPAVRKCSAALFGRNSLRCFAGLGGLLCPVLSRAEPPPLEQNGSLSPLFHTVPVAERLEGRQPAHTPVRLLPTFLCAALGRRASQVLERTGLDQLAGNETDHVPSLKRTLPS